MLNVEAATSDLRSLNISPEPFSRSRDPSPSRPAQSSAGGEQQHPVSAVKRKQVKRKPISSIAKSPSIIVDSPTSPTTGELQCQPHLQPQLQSPPPNVSPLQESPGRHYWDPLKSPDDTNSQKQPIERSGVAADEAQPPRHHYWEPTELAPNESPIAEESHAQPLSPSLPTSSSTAQSRRSVSSNTAKRTSVLYLERNSATPNFSTPTNFRHSVQIPASHQGGFFESLSQRYSNTSDEDHYEPYEPPSSYKNEIPREASHRNSVAIGVSESLDFGFSPSPIKQWKYHIQKNLKDFYLTTNPDAKHIAAPRAPSYYVEVDVNTNKSGTGQHGFTLSLVNPLKGFCEISVTRRFRERTDEEFFDIVTYKEREQADKSDEFDFSNSPSRSPNITEGAYNEEQDQLEKLKAVDLSKFMSQDAPSSPQSSQRAQNSSNGSPRSATEEGVVSWQGSAMPMHTTIEGTFGTIQIKQYKLLDQRGRQWVVGNRYDHHDFNFSGGDEESEELEPVTSRMGSMSDGKHRKKSTRVYFFAPGYGGSESDKIMAVLKRRKQVHKQIAKDISRFAHKTTHSISEKLEAAVDEGDSRNGGTSPHKAFFRGKFSKLSSGSTTSINNSSHLSNNTSGITVNQNQFTGSQETLTAQGLTYSNTPSNPLSMTEEENQDKFGWLTLFENVKNRPGMWPLVVAMSMAVSFSQRLDKKENSIQQKMKNLGRKYKEARLQVYHGHRHTRSAV